MQKASRAGPNKKYQQNSDVHRLTLIRQYEVFHISPTRNKNIHLLNHHVNLKKGGVIWIGLLQN